MLGYLDSAYHVLVMMRGSAEWIETTIHGVERGKIRTHPLRGALVFCVIRLSILIPTSVFKRVDTSRILDVKTERGGRGGLGRGAPRRNENCDQRIRRRYDENDDENDDDDAGDNS